MINWHRGFSCLYESAWGISQKLSWLNAECPNRLVQLIASSYVPISVDGVQRSYRDLSWLTNFSRRREPSIVEQDAMLAVFAEADPCKLWGEVAGILLDSTVRVCLSCLRLGYHSIVHQLKGLLYCPIHEEWLTDRCPRCEVTVASFAVNKLMREFRCRKCDYDFLQDDRLHFVDPAFQRLEAQRIGPLVEWLGRVTRTRLVLPIIGYSSIHYWQDGDGYLKISWAATLLHIYRQIEPYPGEPNLLYPLAQGLLVEDVAAHIAVPNREGSQCSYHDPQNDIAAVRETLGKAVKAVEERLLSRMPLHHRCWDQLRGLVGVYGAGDDIMGVDGCLCGFALALAFWRIRVDAGLANLVTSIRQDYLPNCRDLNVEELTQDLESSFYYNAQAVCIIQKRHRPPRTAILYPWPTFTDSWFCPRDTERYGGLDGGRRVILRDETVFERLECRGDEGFLEYYSRFKQITGCDELKKQDGGARQRKSATRFNDWRVVEAPTAPMDGGGGPVSGEQGNS